MKLFHFTFSTRSRSGNITYFDGLDKRGHEPLLKNLPAKDQVDVLKQVFVEKAGSVSGFFSKAEVAEAKAYLAATYHLPMEEIAESEQKSGDVRVFWPKPVDRGEDIAAFADIVLGLRK